MCGICACVASWVLLRASLASQFAWPFGLIPPSVLGLEPVRLSPAGPDATVVPLSPKGFSKMHARVSEPGSLLTATSDHFWINMLAVPFAGSGPHATLLALPACGPEFCHDGFLVPSPCPFAPDSGSAALILRLAASALEPPFVNRTVGLRTQVECCRVETPPPLVKKHLDQTERPSNCLDFSEFSAGKIAAKPV